MTPSISLNVSPDILIPADAAVQKIAWLGISGSGKTYGCGKFVEELIRTGAQTLILDTIGNWWGLRLKADGKSPGLLLPILGGAHGDIALEAGHGKLVAQTFVESGTSMIVDVSEMTNAEIKRFVVDFATELLRLAMGAPAPRHIVWEECQDIVPQKVFGDDARVLSAVQRLIKKGRNYGVGCSLISQRVAAVNKEVLNQCHTLFSFRTIAKLDRKAIEEWVSDHDDGDGDVDGQRPPLSRLDTGRCLVYSPHWLKVSKEISIGKKWTFDASATPDFTTNTPKALTLSKVDLAKFKTTMATAIEKAKDNDPEHLKKRIRELEALTVDGAMKPATDEYKAKFEANEAELHELRHRMTTICARIPTHVADLVQVIRTTEAEFVRMALAPLHGGVIPVRQPANPPPGTVMTPRETARQIPMRQNMVMPNGLSTMTRKFLTVLAQRGTALPKGKLLVYASYAPSGKCSEAFAEMIANAWAESPTPGTLQITAAGRKKLGAFTPLAVGEALFREIMEGSRLNTMEKKFLVEIRRVYPGALGKGVILEAAGYAPSGKCSEAFASLVRNDYATKDGPGFLRLSDDLVNNPQRRA